MQQSATLTERDQMKKKIRETFHQAWDRGNVDALDDIFTEDFQRRSTQSGESSTLEQFKAEIVDIRSAFPDLKTTIDSILIEGDKAAIYWHSTGTFTESFNGVPATGGHVVTHGSNLATLEGDRIAHEDVTWDARELLAGLGLKSLSSAFESHDVETVNEDFSGRYR